MDNDLWGLAFKLVLIGLVGIGLLVLGIGIAIGVAL